MKLINLFDILQCIQMYPQNRYCDSLYFIVSNQSARKPPHFGFHNRSIFLNVLFEYQLFNFTYGVTLFGRQSWIPKQPQIHKPIFWAKLNMRKLVLTYAQDSQKGLPLVDCNHNIFIYFDCTNAKTKQNNINHHRNLPKVLITRRDTNKTRYCRLIFASFENLVFRQGLVGLRPRALHVRLFVRIYKAQFRH